MHRIKSFTLEEVLPHIGQSRWGFHVGKRRFNVKMSQQRMLLMQRTQKCACCGAKGTHFWLEHSGCMPPHFNLYGLNYRCQIVLMTVDHVIPRSQGGQTCETNIQLLCAPCNTAKKDDDLTLDQLRQRVFDQHLSSIMGGYRGLFEQHQIPRGYRAALVRLIELGYVANNDPLGLHLAIQQNTNFQAFVAQAREIQASPKWPWQDLVETNPSYRCSQCHTLVTHGRYVCGGCGVGLCESCAESGADLCHQCEKGKQ